MVDIAGFINGLNQFTQTVGAIQGAAEVMMPAVNAVGHSVNQIAGVFTGDTYQPNPYPVYPVYPPMPIGSLQEGKVGIVGSMLAGGTAGAITGKGIGEAIKAMQAGTGSFKAVGMGALKAGGIGAAVTGVISAAKNMSLTSKGMQSSADAGGNIAADTIGGLLSGATGGLAAGAASMALANAIPGGGLALTIGTVVAGALGATGAHLAYNATGLRDGIANKLRGLFGGSSGYQQPGYGYPPQQGYGYPPQQYGYGY